MNPEQAVKRITPFLFVAWTLALSSGCAGTPPSPPPPVADESQARPALDAKYTSTRSLYVANAIMPRWKRPPGTDINARALVRMEITENGAVAVAEITESDGDSAFNDSVMQAVYRVRKLSVDDDTDRFDPVVNVCISQNPGSCR